MKYLIACGILPPEIGGPATVISELARSLVRAGHDVTIITYTEHPDALPGVRIVSVPRGSSALMRYLRFAQALLPLVKKADTVFATDVFSVGIPTRLALIGTKTKFILRLGGEWRWESAVNRGERVTLEEIWARPLGIRGRIEMLNYRWILERASRILVTSQVLGEKLRTIASTQIEVIPNLPPMELERPVLHEAHRPLRLLYVGRFEPVKNMPFFAGVLSELHKRSIPVACTMVGSGSELLKCKEVLKAVPNISFLGARPHSELRTLFFEHDVLVLPSLSDICPNSVVEALASGLPCLVTNGHGLPRPLHGAIECDPKDAEAWIDAIMSLTNANAYQELSQAVRPIEVQALSLFEAVTDV